jgi:hypothetical protein
MVMQNKKYARGIMLSCLILLGLFASCHDDEALKSRRYAKLPEFYMMELNDVFDVYLIHDTTNAIEVQGHEDVITKVEFKVDTGILRISNEARVKWLAPEKGRIRLLIHSTALSSIQPNETCFITTINPIIVKDFRIVMGHRPKVTEINLELNCDSFYYWNNHQCGGRVTLSGNTKVLSVYSYALMTVDAGSLMADHARVENNSKGDVTVRVQNKLEYSIRGVGDIYLRGDPGEVIPDDVTSSGRLIKIE